MYERYRKSNKLVIIFKQKKEPCDWECLGAPLIILAFPGQSVTTALIMESTNSVPIIEIVFAIINTLRGFTFQSIENNKRF